MALYIQENGMITLLLAGFTLLLYHFIIYTRALIPGKMGESTAETGRITTCMVTEFTHGRTEGTTKEPTTLTKKTGMVCTPGLMEESMMGSGKMEYSTVMGSINILRIRTKRLVIGRKVREKCGLPKKNPTLFQMS